MFVPSFRSYSACFILAGLAACQHATVAPASAHTNATSNTNASPRPTVAVAATPDGLAPDSNGERAAVEASPFLESVRLGYAARLDVAGQRAFLTTEKLLLAVYDDGVRVEPALLEGLRQGRSAFPNVFGSMPESGWVVQTSYAERTSRSSLSRWTGSEWVNADASLQSKNVLGISTWSAGRALVLVANDYEKQLGFVQLGGARGAPLPQLPRTAYNTYGCVHGIQPAGMSALPSGEVFLVGTRCSVTADEEQTAHGVVVESWGPGQIRPKVSVLPGLAEHEAAFGEISSIVASSASDVFVAGARVLSTPADQPTKELAYLAHFDGKAWRAFSAPPIERIEELQRAPNGQLWALHGGKLWTTVGRASESAAWQHVPMPQLGREVDDHAVTSFWVQDNQQVWATLGSEDVSYLVRTQRSAEPLSAPSDAQVARLSQAFDPMAAYQCQSPTLVLLALSRHAPQDADAPSVRAALHGHPELEGKVELVELPFLTRRYLGVRGDMDSLLDTEEILSRASIPGVAPELRCLDTSPTRTLAVDFGGVKPDRPASNGGAYGKSANSRARTVGLGF